MATEFGEFDLQRDLDNVKQRYEEERQKVYFGILKAPPNTPAHLIERATEFLKYLDVEETKQLQAFRDAYLREP